MNVSEYLKRTNPPAPHIHEDAFMEEFRNIPTFGVAGKQRLEIAEEIEGGKQPSVEKSGNILFLDGLRNDSHIKIDAGEDVWGVFGDFGKPLQWPNESIDLHNPRHLSEKEIFKARWQEQNGYANDFTQRQENIRTGQPLNDIKNAEFQNAYDEFKNNMDWEGEGGGGIPAAGNGSGSGSGSGSASASASAPQPKERRSKKPPQPIHVEPIRVPKRTSTQDARADFRFAEAGFGDESGEVRNFQDWATEFPEAAGGGNEESILRKMAKSADKQKSKSRATSKKAGKETTFVSSGSPSAASNETQDEIPPPTLPPKTVVSPQPTTLPKKTAPIDKGLYELGYNLTKNGPIDISKIRSEMQRLNIPVSKNVIHTDIIIKKYLSHLEKIQSAYGAATGKKWTDLKDTLEDVRDAKKKERLVHAAKSKVAAAFDGNDQMSMADKIRQMSKRLVSKAKLDRNVNSMPPKKKQAKKKEVVVEGLGGGEEKSQS